MGHPRVVRLKRGEPVEKRGVGRASCCQVAACRLHYPTGTGVNGRDVVDNDRQAAGVVVAQQALCDLLEDLLQKVNPRRVRKPLELLRTGAVCVREKAQKAKEVLEGAVLAAEARLGVADHPRQLNEPGGVAGHQLAEPWVIPARPARPLACGHIPENDALQRLLQAGAQRQEHP